MSDKNPRLIATVKLAAFIIAYLAVSILIGILVRFVPAKIMAGLYPVLGVLMPVTLVLCFRFLWDKEPLATMGMEATKTWGYEFLSGFGVGAILITIIFVMTAVSGGLTFKSHFSGGIMNIAFLGILVFLFIGTLMTAFSEELVFRGYLFFTIRKGWGVPVAVLVSSFLFGFGHVFNPGFSWVVGLNLTLTGVLLALGVVITKNIWWPLGLHAAWNFLEGSVYGFPVSGFGAGSISLLITKVTAPKWLLGGSFGPEAGLASTVVVLLGMAWLWFFEKRRRTVAGTA